MRISSRDLVFLVGVKKKKSILMKWKIRFNKNIILNYAIGEKKDRKMEEIKNQKELKSTYKWIKLERKNIKSKKVQKPFIIW